MPRIALSYRRADSAAISGRIFDRLSQHYGTGSVFMDIDEIPFGIDFRDHVAEVLSTCDAVVVVIGQRWFGGDTPPRRIDDETDPVRIEVQAALDRKVPVVPILVDGAAMPDAETLPDPLKPLAYRNACPVDTGRDFHAHVDRLVRSLDRLLAPAPADPVRKPDPPPAPVRPEPTAPARIAAPRDARRDALMVAFLALPQLVQFAQRSPLVVVAIFVSTVGAATLADRVDQPTATRVATALAVMCGVVIVQSVLALVRASLLSW